MGALHRGAGWAGPVGGYAALPRRPGKVLDAAVPADGPPASVPHPAELHARNACYGRGFELIRTRSPLDFCALTTRFKFSSLSSRGARPTGLDRFVEAAPPSDVYTCTDIYIK